MTQRAPNLAYCVQFLNAACSTATVEYSVHSMLGAFNVPRQPTELFSVWTAKSASLSAGMSQRFWPKPMQMCANRRVQSRSAR